MKKLLFIFSLIALAGCGGAYITRYMSNDCEREGSYCQGMVYGSVRALQALARAHYAPEKCIPQQANIGDITKIYSGILKKSNDARLATSAGVVQAVIGYSMVMHCPASASLKTATEMPITDCQGSKADYCRGIVIGVIDTLFLASKIKHIPEGCIASTWKKADLERVVSQFSQTPYTGEKVAAYITSLWLTQDSCQLREKFQ